MDGSDGKRKELGKRALVAGGAGFLGSHLCARLLQDGFEVVAVDNLVTGSLSNLEPLLRSKAMSFVEHDITQPLDIPADRIFNLACCASPQHCQADPERTVRTCVDGSFNMLQLARRSGARVFLASTSDVYGEPEMHPQKESYRGAVSSIGPRACYDEGKRCAEAAFFDYRRVHGVDIKVARIFNTYGPLMQVEDGRVVSNLIVQALRGSPLTIYGDGTQTRSFCYVDDLIEGIVRLMNTPDFPGPVNLGNPNEVTVLDLASRIIELTRSQSPLVFQPIPTDDPMRRCPDITLARQSLGWAPRISLDKGLRRTLACFRQTMTAQNKLKTAVEVGSG